MEVHRAYPGVYFSGGGYELTSQVKQGVQDPLEMFKGDSEQKGIV